MNWTKSSTAKILIALVFALVLKSADAAELLVADRATNRVLAFDPTTGAFLRTLISSGLDEPSDLAFGPGGYLYVANRGSDTVGVFSPVDGTPIGSGVFLTGQNEPGGLLSHNGELFVAEFNNTFGQFIRRYDAGGNQVGSSIDAGPQGHSGMVIGPDGNLYATDLQTDGFYSGAVESFDASNGFASLGQFASRPANPNGATALLGAAGLTFGADGNLYVAGLFSRNVVKFTVSGGAVTNSEVFNGTIPYPNEIVIGPDGNFLVTSLGNNNPSDPIYGNNLFPGAIYKLAASDGVGAPFITNGASFQPTAILLSPVPEPAGIMLAATAMLGFLLRGFRKRRT
jgi:DNA-binding beta-propeller fold protein YncE